MVYSAIQPIYAMLYSDGALIFQYGNAVDTTKTLVNTYMVDRKGYSNYLNVPWYSQSTNVISESYVGNINVQNKAYWFYNCTNLIGSPVCSDKVTNMAYAYYNCKNLTRSPVCGNNVTNMECAYYSCRNLTGSPVCGEKVTNMYSTYANCTNLAGNMYMFSPNVTNVNSCFNGRNNMNQLNIYVLNGSNSYNTLTNTSNVASRITGRAISYINSGSYLYNTRYNIYIYPVENVYVAYEMHHAPIVDVPELQDFTVIDYKNNYVLMDWKQVTNGVSGTEVIIPYTPNFNVIY